MESIVNPMDFRKTCVRLSSRFPTVVRRTTDGIELTRYASQSLALAKIVVFA